jgi:hypothetical protein
MSQRETDRLLWELVDETIAPADRARLEARLAADPAARDRLTEMRSLAQLLASVEDVPVPEALTTGVGRALAGKPATARPSEAAWLWLGELFAPRWRVRLAWAAAGLALGIAAGILAVADLRKPPVEDVSRFYGAMTHGRDGRSLRLPLADGSGALTVSRDGSTLLVELAVDRPGSTPLALELGGENLILNGLQTDEQTSVEVGPEGGRIALTLEPVSRSLLRVSAPGADAVVGVRVSAGGSDLLEREIRVGEVPAS